MAQGVPSSAADVWAGTLAALHNRWSPACARSESCFPPCCWPRVRSRHHRRPMRLPRRPHRPPPPPRRARMRRRPACRPMRWQRRPKRLRRPRPRLPHRMPAPTAARATFVSALNACSAMRPAMRRCSLPCRKAWLRMMPRRWRPCRCTR
ncbi:hypothetical protein DBR34_06730 [Stenotrophomonas sp. HMWF003]|nr:hypothetical protein DBR34_06730 [Stenotrophomonas sp. HMWF003]